MTPRFKNKEEYERWKETKLHPPSKIDSEKFEAEEQGLTNTDKSFRENIILGIKDPDRSKNLIALIWLIPLVALVLVIVSYMQSRWDSKTIFGLCLILAAYFLPYIIADHRKKRNTKAIFALNLLLGWTVIGWIVCLVWSLCDDAGR